MGAEESSPLATDVTDDVAVARVRDLDVAYLTTGRGDAGQRPLLVMIHGLGQDHRIWGGLQRELSGYPTLAYDLRGHGATTLGQADGSLGQLVDDLLALLEQLGDGSAATLLGFSLGGVIALAAAADRPDLIGSVIAVATSSVVGSAAAAALEDRIALFERGDPEAIHRQLLDDTRAQLADAELDAEAIAAMRLEAVRDPRGYANAARAVRAMRDAPVNDALARIAVPVLLIGGERDSWCPRRAAEIMLEHLPPGASFEEIPGAGHLITDTAGERLAELVRTWINRREAR